MNATQALGLLFLIARSCGIAAVAGVAVSYISGMPEFQFSPTFVLLGVLPPLVYAAALESSYLNLRDSVRSLTLLSVGLVLFTAAVVAWAVRLAVPGLPLAAALTLGAILAPTDAVSAASIGRRL